MPPGDLFLLMPSFRFTEGEARALLVLVQLTEAATAARAVRGRVGSF